LSLFHAIEVFSNIKLSSDLFLNAERHGVPLRVREVSISNIVTVLNARYSCP
jgi:hypothetical protein